MGFCYENGKLCCDICGHAGARKCRCPHGYCQSVACCTSEKCKANLAEHRRTHCAIECKRLHAEFVETEARKAEMLSRGLFLRRAAVGVDGFRNCVRVWFRNGQGAELVRFMAGQTYRALDLLDLATPDDYRAIGEVSETPRDFSPCKSE